MSKSQTTEDQPIGSKPSATCPECNAPLADDQQYCLNCGARCSTSPAFGEVLGSPTSAKAANGSSFFHRPLSVGSAALAAALILIAVGVGMLINSDDDTPQTKATQINFPKTLTIAGKLEGVGAATVAPPTTTTEAEQPFVSDWPEGETGYTIQLQTLPNSTPTADVESAKSAATAKGASNVGALNSDDFSSLDGGNYVIYSGKFDKKKQATKALKKLKKNFSGAKVIKVSSSSSSGGDIKTSEGTKEAEKVLEQLKSKSLPDPTEIPGRTPPQDDSAPGGDDDNETTG